MYVCENKAWREATELEVALGVCGTVDNPNETRKEKSGKYYLCYEKWREITALEYEIGACGGDGGIAQDSFVEKKADEHYYCDGTSWNSIDSLTFALKKVCTESSGESIGTLEECQDESCSEKSNVTYGCSSYNGEWKWVRASSRPYSKICSDLHEEEFVQYGGNYYYCQKKDETFSWLSVTPNAYMLKRLCDADHNLDTVTYSGKKYYCFNYLAYYNLNEGYNKLSTTADLRHYGWYTNLVDYEGKSDVATYAITRIGSQLWMAENLRYRYTNGTVPDSGSYCYDDVYKNCNDYGRLYSWDAAMDNVSSETSDPARVKYPLYDSPVRGLCPIGWHIPSQSDFEKMLVAIGSTHVSGGWSGAGPKLKAKGKWVASGYASEAEDNYGFSALPAGYGNKNAGIMKYNLMDDNAFFWSSTTSSEYAIYFELTNTSNTLYNGSGYKTKAYSVRCVKDDD